MNITERSIKNGKYTYALAWARALKYNAIPAYAFKAPVKKKVLSVYIQAQVKNLETKKRWQVDHIIPLYGVNICGLHVPNNLRVVSKAANQAKSNYFKPYIEKEGKKTYVEGILPLPEKKPYKPPRKGRANPTKKSFKRRMKRLVFGKRNFGK